MKHVTLINIIRRYFVSDKLIIKYYEQKANLTIIINNILVITTKNISSLYNRNHKF